MKNGGKQYHFDPKTYLQNIRAKIPDYDEIQDTIARIAVSRGVKRFLDLGAGTGETANRVLKLAPEAEAVLVDSQESMVAILRERFIGYRAVVFQYDFGDRFPEGPFFSPSRW